MMDLHIDLRGCPRLLHFLPPVSAVVEVDFRYSRRQVVPDLQIALHTHGSPAVHHVLVNGKNFSAGYPHLLIKRPGDVVESEPGAAHSFYFKFAPEALPDFPAGPVLADVVLEPAIVSNIRRMQELLGHAFELGAADRIDCVCHTLLADLLIAAHGPAREPEDTMRIRAAASYLAAHPQSKLDDVARRFGFSRRSFDRHWQSVFHESPGKYARDFKMAEARRLLAESDADIGAIARSLGYGEATNFVAAFRQSEQVTPLAFRRKYR